VCVCVCVLKGHRGENGVRLCCDYRYLNKFTRGDYFPTPDTTDVIQKVGKAFWVPSWDTRSGYWQLMVNPKHRWLTAFLTDFGVFEWVESVRPTALFGLCGKFCNPFVISMILMWMT